MTILNCTCGYEIYIMDEGEAEAWQCGQCGKWLDFFGCEVNSPQMRAGELWNRGDNSQY